MHTFNFKLPVRLFEELREYSKNKGQTVTAILRIIIEEFLINKGKNQ